MVHSSSILLIVLTLLNRTKETFVDGWVRTGDEVYIDKSGDLFVVDRLKVE